MNHRIKQITKIALMSALVSVLAPIAMPIGQVPISLASFIIMLIATVFGSRDAACATIIYLILGAFGLPVFANYAGGLSILTGVTGGYLIGYIPLAIFTGLDNPKTEFHMYKNMMIGTLILYVFGTMWFVLLTGMSLRESLMICVMPFLFGDFVKMIAVTKLAPKLKEALTASNIFKESTTS